ncbi:type IV pilus twitching motility protein PilT [Corallococcus sp. CA049B]|uniref:type IV pilus twitching motility protein PilT n=1 Tax=Corallococcus sp. CA049B TaxID=2316730 RepID=UPI000EA3136B|nr:type IV pilus twitching motility protein PilT [Corallococcus sp. CA049B]RKG86766.1 type IV pilus twitching motility protein PilT [Corallococcus sp. CA049B]
MELNEILQIALRGGASDIHLKAGLPPMFRVDGSLVPLKDGRRLPPEEVARMAFGIMNEFQKEKFKVSNEVDLAYGVPGLGRFRVNVFQQRGTVGAVLRVIPFKVMTMKDLLLPTVLEKVCGEERGLVLVTGTTGSGKSTTLAAMIDYINSNETNHIMTIEDPIEFLIRDKRSIVNQREVGVDTMSFSQALKSALRQDPDVILVGEMRDHETIETALHAAETGHLVMSTLHTLDATETINRIVSAFPPHQQKQVRLQLSSVLRGVVSQRLVPRADGKGRVAAVEVLRVTARVRELIEDKDRTKEIHDAISQGTDSYGMQTFDQSLMSLVRNGLVTYEEAHRQASNPDDFALRFSGISGTSDSKWDAFDAKAGDERPIPGSQSFAQKGAPTQAAPMAPTPTPAPVPQAPRPGAPMAARPMTPPPGVAAPRPATPPPGVVQGRPLPPQVAARPPTPAPVAAPAPAAGGDDDFQIERF